MKQHDFVKRFVSLFSASLTWRWKDVRITTKIHTGKMKWGGCKRLSKDPKAKFLQVYVHLPNSYITEEHGWEENASPIPQACYHIFHTVGLQVIGTDAFVLPEEKSFTFWTEISERVYRNLPSSVEQLTSAEYYGVWE